MGGLPPQINVRFNIYTLVTFRHPGFTPLLHIATTKCDLKRPIRASEMDDVSSLPSLIGRCFEGSI